MTVLLKYACVSHGVHVTVDVEHRAITATVDPQHRDDPMAACYLHRVAYLALENEDGPVGEHGPWHPLRQRPVCTVVREVN